MSWFAFYGDSFGREYHASILVLMEVGLMIGRILNLVPTCYFMPSYNYQVYFITLGMVSLLLIPFYLWLRKPKT